MALGSTNAPVTIIEYSSMTCSHCADFAKETFPKIKASYIDTGKVRFIFREWPLDNLALAAFLEARCIAKNDATKYFNVINTFFSRIDELLSKEPLRALNRVGADFGFSEKQIKACIEDDPSTKKIAAGFKYATDTLKVDRAPFLFINGKPVTGDTSLEGVEKIIKPLL